MKIKIKDQEIELKQSFRTLMLFENITKQSFTITGEFSNILLYFYCNILACGAEDFYWDDFTAYVDENPQVVKNYIEWFGKQKNLFDVFTPKTTEKKTTKKSKSNA